MVFTKILWDANGYHVDNYKKSGTWAQTQRGARSAMSSATRSNHKPQYGPPTIIAQPWFGPIIILRQPEDPPNKIFTVDVFFVITIMSGDLTSLMSHQHLECYIVREWTNLFTTLSMLKEHWHKERSKVFYNFLALHFGWPIVQKEGLFSFCMFKHDRSRRFYRFYTKSIRCHSQIQVWVWTTQKEPTLCIFM